MTQSIAIPIIDRHRDIVAESLVDECDAERVNGLTWSLHPRGYAQANIDGKRVLLHRFVLGMPSVGKGRGSGVFVAQVDHINCDKLDNRRANLRVVTNQQNHENRQGGHGTSRYRGVYFHKASGKWMARYKLNQKTYYVGNYDDEYEAAIAAYEARRANFTYCVEDRPKRAA